MLRQARVGAFWLALCAVAVRPAAAQSPRAAPPVAAAEPPASEPRGAPLRRELGVPVALRLLDAPDPMDRVRGVARLGAIGSAEAVEALVEQLERGSALRDPRPRLEAVRVLASHARKDDVRNVLTRELTDAGAEGRSSLPALSPLVRETAALALARAADKKSFLALVNAIAGGGAAGEAATRALRALPPATIAPLLDPKRPLSAAVVTFLGDLGDLRATNRLRALLADREIDVRIAAAIALAKLGDDAPLSAARGWALRPEPKLARAAAEVLARVGAPDAARAIGGLLQSETTRADGVRLALLAPTPGLAPALIASLGKLPEELAAVAAAALGRTGTDGAADELAVTLGRIETRPALASAAALALALVPGPRARAALDRVLVGPRLPPALPGASARARARALASVRRLALRAGLVRALVVEDPSATLLAALRAATRSADPVDRAIGAFGVVALDIEDTEDEIIAACPRLLAPAPRAAHPPTRSPCDSVRLAAIARGALARGPEAVADVLPWLERLAARADVSPSMLTAAGVALLARPDGGEVSTAQLAAWAEGGGALAPLAARALPSRDDEVVRGRIKRLLEGSDPVIRAHVALGLGRDPEADAVSVLAAAYRFEEDPGVRRAIVRALSLRGEVQRRAVLALARDLDPDAGVRALASSALAGRKLWPTWDRARHGDPVAWVTLAAADPDSEPGPRAARLLRADGLAAPTVSDPDGVLLVPGMTLGVGGVLLARPPAPGEPPAP